MSVFPIIFTVLLVPYIALGVWTLSGIRKLLRTEDGEDFQKTEKTGFSIIIPFRNEQQRLPELLDSLSRIDYPPEKFEILMVNDHSHDRSVALIEAFAGRHPETGIRIIDNKRQSDSPKKDALLTGIRTASYEWILTTDADTVVPASWLSDFDRHIRRDGSVMLFGGVRYLPGNTPVEYLQYWDWQGLQALTLAGYGYGNPLLGSAANMGFEKEAFFRAGGFEGNTQHAGGDDIFLMRKMHERFPGKVKSVRSSHQVTTYPVAGWKDLCRQRIRWAEKTSAVGNPVMIRIAVLTGAVQIALLGSLPYSLFYSGYPILFAGIWTSKFLVDYLLVSNTLSAKKEKRALSWWSLFALQPVYAALVLCIALRLLAGGKFSWKEREYPL